MGNGHLADVSDHEPGVLGRTVKNHTDDSPPDQTKRTFSIVFVLVMNPITISTQNRTWVSIQTKINHPPSRGKGIIITDPNRHGLLCKTNVIVKEKREKTKVSSKVKLGYGGTSSIIQRLLRGLASLSASRVEKERGPDSETSECGC